VGSPKSYFCITLLVFSEPTSDRLRASSSHRDGFCCRTPVSRASSEALTAFFPVSRCTIFCLNATEYGLVILHWFLAPCGSQMTRQLRWHRGPHHLLPMSLNAREGPKGTELYRSLTHLIRNIPDG